MHIGYIAGIVAASNAGGSGSVVGDTTTTMMWIDGVSPFDVVAAYIPASARLMIFAFSPAFNSTNSSAIVPTPARHRSTGEGRYRRVDSGRGDRYQFTLDLTALAFRVASSSVPPCVPFRRKERAGRDHGIHFPLAW